MVLAVSLPNRHGLAFLREASERAGHMDITRPAAASYWRAQIEKAGAVHRPYPGTEEMAKRGNVEVKFTGPDGVTIDLSEHGWLGTK